VSDQVSHFSDDLLARITGSGRAPDFLGIGVQKGGTTWLYENLRNHPEIFMPRVKEIQYFNEIYVPRHRTWIGGHRKDGAQRALKAYLHGVPPDKTDLAVVHSITSIAIGPTSDEWYRRLFALSSAQQICGEITPEYSLLPRAGIIHAVKLSRGAKIILLLRDPIARNWSHIRMLMEKNNPGSPEPLKMLAWTDVVDRARYGDIYRRWCSAASPADVMVDTIDQISASPLSVLERVCRFLGIGFKQEYFARATQPVHVGNKHEEIPEDIYRFLREQLAPIYDDIINVFPFAAEWRKRHY